MTMSNLGPDFSHFSCSLETTCDGSQGMEHIASRWVRGHLWPTSTFRAVAEHIFFWKRKCRKSVTSPCHSTHYLPSNSTSSKRRGTSTRLAPRNTAQTATRRRTQHMWWPTCASTGAPTSRRRETACLRGPPELWRTRASGQFGQLPRSIFLLSRWQARPVCIGLTLQSRGTLTPCRVLPGSRLLRLRRPPEGASPLLVNALRKVMSTASCAPLKQGRSWASTSILLESCAATLMFMSRRKTFCLTQAPASRKMRATVRSVGVALFLMRPLRVRRRMVAAQSPRTLDLQRQLKHHHSVAVGRPPESGSADGPYAAVRQ